MGYPLAYFTPGSGLDPFNPLHQTFMSSPTTQSPFDLAAADKSRLFPAAAAASWFNSAYPGYSGAEAGAGQQTQLQSSKMTSEPSSTPSPSLPTPPPEPTKDQSFTPPALPVSAAASAPASFNSFYSSLYAGSKPSAAGQTSPGSSSQAASSSFPAAAAAAAYGSSLQQPNYSLPGLDQLRRPMPMLF